MKKLVWIIILIGAIALTFTGCVGQDAKIESVDYDMDILVNVDNKSCEAVTRINYRNTSEKTDTVSLVMNSLAYVEGAPIEKHLMSQAYPLGVSYGEAVIHGAEINGVACSVSTKGNQVVIKSPKFIKKGGDIELSISYYLKLPQCKMRYGYNSVSMNFAQFYPQLARADEYSDIGDPFYSEVADYTVNVTYPKQYNCLASGEEVGRVADGNSTRVAYSAEKIRDFAFSVAFVGNVISKSNGNYTVNYMYNMDLEWEKRLDLALSVLEFYSQKFGAQDNKTFNIVATPFIHGGMEYGGLVVVNSEIIDTKVKNDVIVHELAHQWWYSTIGSDQINHAWQDEGLAEFSVYYYYSSLQDSTRANNYLWLADKAVKDYNSSDSAVDERMDKPLNDFISGDEYVYAVYSKGLLMFHNIYQLMGDELFINAIQDYYQSGKYRINEPHHLFQSLNHYHVGISEVMKAWLNGYVISI